MMTEEVGADASSRVPSPEIVHNNIGLANSYRLELSKTMLALAAALFAFTTSFPPALTAISHVWLLAGSLGVAWCVHGRRSR
jgi:hypothetical protein